MSTDPSNSQPAEADIVETNQLDTAVQADAPLAGVLPASGKNTQPDSGYAQAAAKPRSHNHYGSMLSTCVLEALPSKPLTEQLSLKALGSFPSDVSDYFAR